MQHPPARKSLFQLWTRGEEKLLVMFVALHCLELDSSWPKYKIKPPVGRGSNFFFIMRSSVEISITGNDDADVHEATAPHYQYGIKSKSQDK